MVNVNFCSGAGEVGNTTIRVLNYDGNGIFLDYGPKHEWGMDGVCKPVAKDIVLSHGHRDHCAAIGQYAIRSLKRELRRVHSKKFDREHMLSDEPETLYLPKFYGTEQTREAVKLQIADSAKIAISEKKNFSREKGELLFNESDVEELIRAIDKRWVSTDGHREVAIGDFRIRQVSAGHIAGSAITEVTHNDIYSGRSKKVVYTGDISLHKNILGEGPELDEIEKGCDLLIMESTYGDVNRAPMDEWVREFKDKIKQYVGEGKTIFLPVFALERSQMAVKYVNEALAELPKSRTDGYSLYYLSSLGENFRKKIYHGLDMGDFDFERSKERFEGDGETLRKPAIVVSSSGSGEGGYAAGLLPEIAQNPNAVILRTTSFMAPDSPVEEIWKKGRLTVRHYGKKVKKIKVRAKLDSVSLSAHASQDELVEIALTLQPKKIALIHGRPEARLALAESLWTLGYKVVLPRDGDTLRL